METTLTIDVFLDGDGRDSAALKEKLLRTGFRRIYPAISPGRGTRHPDWTAEYHSPISVSGRTQAFWEKRIAAVIVWMRRISYRALDITVSNKDRYIVYEYDKLSHSWFLETSQEGERHHRLTGPAVYSDDEMEEWVLEGECCADFSGIKNELDLVRYVDEEPNGILVARHLVENKMVDVSPEFEENLKIVF